jgi:hypothetical protein
MSNMDVCNVQEWVGSEDHVMLLILLLSLLLLARLRAL